MDAPPPPDKSILDILHSSLEDFSLKYPEGLPCFSGSETLLIASDYSGEHKEAPCYVFSFLITTLASWEAWENERTSLRKEFLPDSRRMSFKNLKDTHRKAALPSYLQAANKIDGISYSLVIDKKEARLFHLDLSAPHLSAYKKWPPNVLNKACTIVVMLGILLAKLAKPGQNVLWVTDEDSIAANDERLTELTQLFAWVVSSQIPFMLGHARCCTAKSDTHKQLEDLLFIPDAVSGALSEQFTRSRISQPVENVFWISRADFSEKTRDITWWYAAPAPLKKLVTVVDENRAVSLHHFRNQE